MAHFSLVFHMASGTLASGELQREQRECEDQPPIPLAKKARLSRPNNIEEIRRKRSRRRKRKRQEERKMSMKTFSTKLREKTRKNLQLANDQFTKELSRERNRAQEHKKKAIFYWKKWCRERSQARKELQLRQIDRNNLKDFPMDEILGKGRFGCCKKKLYRGKVVAVKYFNGQTTSDGVTKEAAMINGFDHDGLPYVFGVCTDSKPYFMVMECYGINDKSMTLAEAAKNNLLSTENKWGGALLKCAESILHFHKNNYIHCDLKGDNIVFNDVGGEYFPIVIDFGKMKKVCEAKVKKLSVREQEKYIQHHKHIAPEIVYGTHPPTKASDVYAFGLIISLICHYHKFENLRLIAASCINGTPKRRPSVEQIIDKLIVINV